MRILSTLVVILLSSVVCAQGREAREESQQKTPTTLAEAHAELERVLPAETLAEIDGMTSECEMVRYHFSLGLSIRNGWGLWHDSPLARYMQQLGFTHPDDMSGVILETFWCKRHGTDFRLEERAMAPQKAKEAFEKARQESIQEAKGTIRDLSTNGVLSLAFLVGGLICLVLSKIARYRQGVWLSFGPGRMTTRYVALYKAACLLTGVGVLLMALMLNALRVLD